MQINLIGIGNKMPSWVNEGYHEYQKRLTQEVQLNLIEIPLNTRGKNADIPRLIDKEGDKMLQAIPAHSHIVNLEIKGKPWSTEQLAERLDNWKSLGKQVSILIGGPEGLAPQCLEAANERWSLSPLTLPHPLVRVVVAEQIYRAWSILAKHPYHR
jgi:23S rRNA (pseudouridine1915-N3)-methyltransferase